MTIKGVNSRSWVSPMTAIAFVALSITGLFMLFHVRIPGFHVLHEMMGILFCVAGVYHLVLNWRPLMQYCRSRAGVVALTITALLGVLLLIGGAGHEQNERHEGHGGPPSVEEE